MFSRFCLSPVRLFLFVIVALFFGFGSYHITKFETTDEHFWKYERIPQYWEAIRNLHPKQTAINDKPGITTALISGIGMLVGESPQNHRVRDDIATQGNIFTIYDTTLTQKINATLRIPILLFNGCFLFYFFWVLRKVTRDRWLSLWSTLFIGLSPILIGISQIINPDAFLWTFGASALLSFIALLRTNEKKFLALTAVLTGCALLSKYTANILFPIYLFLIFSHFILRFASEKTRSPESIRRYFHKEFVFFTLIFLGASIVFSIFMPAALVKPILLYKATIGFPLFHKLLWPIATTITLTLADIHCFKAKILRVIAKNINDRQYLILRACSLFAFIFFGAIFINGATGNAFIPFDVLLETAKSNGKLAFPTLQNAHPLVAFTQKLLLQAYPFTFSLPTTLLLLLLGLWLKISFTSVRKHKLLFLILTIIPFLYFSAALFGDVLTNARYTILLYPLMAILGALGIRALLPNASAKHPIIITIALIILSTLSLIRIQPFYFNYANSFLPRQFTVHDGWGYGSYEAATYLNSLPNAASLIIWTDRNTVCQFFVGKCLSGTKINVETVVPDYFIITKRGVERGYTFVWKGPSELVPHPRDYYYTQESLSHPAWQLFIDDRPENFIKAIPVR
ncbi:MAG: glycosyltransferase family 39 protein [Candidatus Moranbacteria bacterium]|nr:glycosyltransferase family 39 protein [Candidatus Moranbacteria bacterium]